MRLFNSHELDSLSNIAGFSDRNWALNQLTYNENGTRDVETYLAISFIGWLFILFECLPVFVKLMSPKGPYDVALGKMGEAGEYYAEKDKQREMKQIDSISGPPPGRRYGRKQKKTHHSAIGSRF